MPYASITPRLSIRNIPLVPKGLAHAAMRRRLPRILWQLKAVSMAIRQRGVTLIELMVTLAVLAILVTLAAPSFAEFRERQALRGVADSLVATLGLAKEEAIKRDTWVRVDFKGLGDGVCMGAKVVTAPNETGCDCTAADAATACEVALFPEVEIDLKRVRLTPGSIDFGAAAGFVIDPKTATMADLAGVGGLQLVTERGYKADFQVNALARPTVCTPSGATKSLPGVAEC